MTPAERNRLAGVLGLLGSPHPGERDAAALAADRLVRGRGLSWDALLQAAAWPQMRAEPRPPPGGDLWECARSMHLLTEWEADFIVSVSQQRSLSGKQKSVLARIAAKVRATGQ